MASWAESSWPDSADQQFQKACIRPTRSLATCRARYSYHWMWLVDLAGQLDAALARVGALEAVGHRARGGEAARNVDITYVEGKIFNPRTGQFEKASHPTPKETLNETVRIKKAG